MHCEQLLYYESPHEQLKPPPHMYTGAKQDFLLRECFRTTPPHLALVAERRTIAVTIVFSLKPEVSRSGRGCDSPSKPVGGDKAPKAALLTANMHRRK